MQTNIGHKLNSTLISLALLLFSSVLLLNGQAAQAFGIGIQPSTVEMTVKPGDRHRQVITVGNVHKTKTISLTMSLADWSLDKNGKLVLSPPGETERSAADWIRFSPASVTLKPETSQDVIVEISVPYKIKSKGDHRFALLATTLLPELDKRGDISGVWNRYQLASLFYLTTIPSKSTPQISNVKVVGQKNKYLSMDLKNTGDAHARLKGTAYFKNKAGQTAAELPLNTVVLDKSERNYLVKLDPVKDLKPGEAYKVEFELNNTFAPQNKFKATPVNVPSIEYHAP